MSSPTDPVLTPAVTDFDNPRVEKNKDGLHLEIKEELKDFLIATAAVYITVIGVKILIKTVQDFKKE